MKDGTFYMKHIFWIFVPANTLASLILYFFDLEFANLIAFGPMKSFLIFYLGFISIQFLITPLVTYSYTKKVKHSLGYFFSGYTTEEERTFLVKRLNKFPVQKAIDTLVLFFLGNLFILIYLRKYIGLNLQNFLPVFVGSWAIAYFCAMIAFGTAQKLCSRFSSKIVANGIEERVIKNEKFFGLNDKMIITLLVINPIGASGLLIFFCSFVPENQFQKMLFCIVFTVVLVCYGLLLFCSYMKRYLGKVQKSLEVLSLENIGHFNYTDNIKEFDMANGYTYSIYLTNKTIEMFLNLIEETKRLNSNFAEISSGLKITAENIVNVTNDQGNDLDSVKSSISTTADLSKEILNRVKEVSSVAAKTNSDVGYCMDAIRDNISKMTEIISTNQSTIHGIQELANKIKTVREIINLIDTVAEQTKIIAFNTEIEAESIKSNDEVFFNLATEIRLLADSTMDLTSQIREQIKELQVSTSALVVTGESCTKKITAGNKFMLDLEKRFSDVKQETEKMAKYSGKVNADLNSETDVFSTVLKKLGEIESGMEQFNVNSTKVVSILDDLNNTNKTIENLSYGNI